MNTRSIVAMNAAWAVVAAGAFLIGKSDRAGGNSADIGGRNSELRTRGVVSALPGSNPSGTSEGASNRAAEIASMSPATAGKSMAAALSENDPIRRKALVAELLLNLSPENVDEVLAAFEDAPKGEETDRHFRDFLYAWGRLGGGDAVAYATDPESARRTSWGSTTAISGWAVTDLGAAKQYVAGVENVETRQWMHYGVMREMMRTDLDGAIAYSEQNVQSRARGVQMDRLASEIIEQRGVEGLTDWLAGIDHSQENNNLLSYKQYAAGITLDRLAQNDPDAALKFITENASQPFITADGLERAARRAAGPIDEELNWLAELPGELGGRQHAIGERFEDYIREDFSAAGEWLAAQPLGPAYDEAIQDYANSAARDDREAAIAWAERITDPKIREDTIRRINPQPKVISSFIEVDQG